MRPRRALGQSFLTYQPTVTALVEALAAGPDDAVLEVGPGKGALTERLVGRVRRVVAVELDERLVRILRDRFGGRPDCEVVHGDFLEFPLAFSTPVRVIGNLPYNISSQVLFRLLDNVDQWCCAVLTSQREFAARVLAASGSKDYGAISVFTDLECRRERLFNIPASHFKPRPDVVSTAFRLVRRSEPVFRLADPGAFRAIVKASFRQRRKTLANNLLAAGLARADAERALAACGLEPRVRAEQLSVGQFRDLALELAGTTRGRR